MSDMHAQKQPDDDSVAETNEIESVDAERTPGSILPFDIPADADATVVLEIHMSEISEDEAFLEALRFGISPSLAREGDAELFELFEHWKKESQSDDDESLYDLDIVVNVTQEAARAESKKRRLQKYMISINLKPSNNPRYDRALNRALQRLGRFLSRINWPSRKENDDS